MTPTSEQIAEASAYWNSRIGMADRLQQRAVRLFRLTKLNAPEVVIEQARRLVFKSLMTFPIEPVGATSADAGRLPFALIVLTRCVTLPRFFGFGAASSLAALVLAAGFASPGHFPAFPDFLRPRVVSAFFGTPIGFLVFVFMSSPTRSNLKQLP